MAEKVIDELANYGCDTGGAMERLMNSVALYTKFLGKFLDDKSFSEVKPFIDSEDYEAALKSVHTLKGVSGNLGLTPIYDISADMVNKFRAGEPEQAVAEYEKLAVKYTEICEIIKANL